MTQLITGVLKAVMPFLVIYLLWVLLFTLIALTLGANKDNAKSYNDLPSTFMGYFLNAFENSLGNINTPTFDFSDGNGKLTFFQSLKVCIVYFFWWLAQIGLMIILLNFVIALISQYYEDVMNSRVMHTYTMKNELNH
jgi:hypothetical protein